MVYTQNDSIWLIGMNGDEGAYQLDYFLLLLLLYTETARV